MQVLGRGKVNKDQPKQENWYGQVFADVDILKQQVTWSIFVFRETKRSTQDRRMLHPFAFGSVTRAVIKKRASFMPFP